jgi:hypothetical protein
MTYEFMIILVLCGQFNNKTTTLLHFLFEFLKRKYKKKS